MNSFARMTLHYTGDDVKTNFTIALLFNAEIKLTDWMFLFLTNQRALI